MAREKKPGHAWTGAYISEQKKWILLKAPRRGYRGVSDCQGTMAE